MTVIASEQLRSLVPLRRCGLARKGESREHTRNKKEIKHTVPGSQGIARWIQISWKGETTRSEIDLVIRLHMEAEMTKLMTALDQLQREAQR